MTTEERLKAIESKYLARGLNPYAYLPVTVPPSFFEGKEDEYKLKIAILLEKILEAKSEDEEKNKDQKSNE